MANETLLCTPDTGTFPDPDPVGLEAQKYVRNMV